MINKPINKIITHLENGIRFQKCWKCGCQQGAVLAIEKKLERLKDLDPFDREQIAKLLVESKKTFQTIQYDCLGCELCFPAVVTNTLTEAYPEVELEPDGCASDDIFEEERPGWPPLPGSYKVIRFEASIAVCTLNSTELIEQTADLQHPQVSIIGSMNTENFGIERIIKNLTTNPNIRFLILCGDDSRQMIGHLPGQSLVSLFENGIYPENKRIIGAKGKRPILKNIDIKSIEQVKAQVNLINLLGCSDLIKIKKAISECAKKKIPPFEGNIHITVDVEKIKAKSPPLLKLDPKGYFVIFPDQAQNLITVEHYQNNGILNEIIEGRDIGSIYMTIIEHNMLSKLDHACYLGKELEKADEFLRLGTPYIQDKAQDIERPSSNCCASKKCLN